MLSLADKQFIQEHLSADLHRLVLSAHRYPDVQVLLAVEQIEALRKVQHKIPAWFRFDLLMPPTRSVEQASSEKTARFKAGLFRGRSMVDLTGGMGIDTWFFSKNFEQVTYIEQDPDLIKIARNNFDVLETRNINTIQADSVEFLRQTSEFFDLIYLDPGRRSEHKGRVFRLSDCQPNILEIRTELLKKGKRVLLKTAPMLDLWQAVQELETVSRIWVVSVGGECKEVLYLLEAKTPMVDQVPIKAVCLGDDTTFFEFTRAEEQGATPEYSPPLQFLYEPDAAVLKAGAFNSFALQYGLLKLHRNTHLYTSESYIPDVPGRSFVVEAISKYDRKAIREVLPGGRANVSARNFPDSPDQMRKKLRLEDGGDWYVFGVTDNTDRKILIACRRFLDNTR